MKQVSHSENESTLTVVFPEVFWGPPIRCTWAYLPNPPFLSSLLSSLLSLWNNTFYLP